MFELFKGMVGALERVTLDGGAFQKKKKKENFQKRF
jgi:hypothetical protein